MVAQGFPVPLCETLSCDFLSCGQGSPPVLPFGDFSQSVLNVFLSNCAVLMPVTGTDSYLLEKRFGNAQKVGEKGKIYRRLGGL